MTIRENPVQEGRCPWSEASADSEAAKSAHAAISGYERFQIYIIKPSKYDDEGYIIRYWKGVLPSNTLACLYGLTEDVRERGVLGSQLKWNIELIDDSVQSVPYREIFRKSRCKKTKVLVVLAGVQTNQFVRASDLALKFRKAGIDVLIGGFHVSGVLSTLPDLTPELVTLKNAGVTIVAGEAEGGHWENLLRDTLQDSLQPVYNFLNDLPDISCSPFPRSHPKLRKHYSLQHFGTLDCGRGCPFGCSFCTVINVQGRRMRFRAADQILAKIRRDYRRAGITHYFFTDDNFCRNKNWEAIFDGLIEMREKEKMPILFMMQLDTQSHLVPNFVDKAARAGCAQVFIGMESLNQENLKAAKKTQNEIENFKHLVDSFQKAGIICHLAYIIGFPLDTVASVKKDVEQLMTLHAGQASFFMMTPLPGSVDYKNVREKRVLLDADLNNYDTFHETHRHPRMKPGEWQRAYEEAWKSFYNIENMKTIMRFARPDNYWGIFFNFVWYKNSIQVEGGHPMLHGFVRFKPRLDRRTGYPVDGRWKHFRRRVVEVRDEVVGWFRLSLELEEVWLATRKRRPLEEKVIAELARITQSVKEWRDLRISELQELYKKAAEALSRKGTEKIRVPSRIQLWFLKGNLFYDKLTFTRVPMRRFWQQARTYFKQGKIFKVDYFRLVRTWLEEAFLFLRFLRSLVKSDTFLT
ncbi:MAG TPA: radical SAM protein [Candidatus Omnitrophota bacterium]|nr:radical SAM protein [Candidatus Omnitrophota bacterium]HPS37572.1 radical SAM protein [Candidatus Omnitrophota bacterium]